MEWPTGQQRRAWLDRKSQGIADTLSYYLGPTGIPQRLEGLANLAQFTDAGDMVEAGNASQAVWNEPNLENFARYATAGAALALPVVSARGAGLVDDAVSSGVDDIRRYLTDEDGAIRAWHGSPHDFDRFSMDKIGTGEGAQAYGHGLYFAESPDVARNYQEALASGYRIDGVPYNATTVKAGATTPGHHAADALDRFKGDREAAIEWLRGGGPTDQEAARLLRRAKSVEPWRGSLYEVNIDANPEDFLDWDAPLSAQPPGVSERLARIVKSRDRMPKEWLDASPGAERTMAEEGIPGIRYLDAGSRGAGDGSRNYVVFDDQLVTILKKYGLAGLMAGGGISSLPQQEEY